MPLGTDISGGGSQSVTDTTNNWKNRVTASPVSVEFKKSVANYGNAYFSLNYVDKDNLVDFSKRDDATSIASAWAGQDTSSLSTDQKNAIFNPTGVQSKMINSNGKFVLDPKASFNGGYLQATGNVPIQAAIAGSRSSVDASMSGDWAVMVRVQVADGMDAKALAASIDWDKSYYYLSIDSIPMKIVGITIAQQNINFPLQFDHHVYLDPNNPHQFFLKVKGIPFMFDNQESGTNGLTYGRSQLKMQNGNADYVDYLNNRQIDKGKASTLDHFGTKNSKDAATSLDDSTLTTSTSSGTQPAIAYQEQDNTNLTVNTMWDPYNGIITFLNPNHSPVYSAGLTGQMASLLNIGHPTTSRKLATGWGSGFRTSIMQFVTSYFTNAPFTGSAHINFSFDMDKYSAGTSSDEQQITNGRLFPSPNANGTFNNSKGADSSQDPIKITMYDSSQLVDPYSVTSGVDTETDDTATTQSPMQKVLHTSQANQTGKTPADYAVINKDDLDKGTTYDTYTNFSSWTGAIMPYDRMHWTDDDKDSQDATYNDTMHSSPKLQKTGTASPDPTQDGILMNDGSSTGYDIVKRSNLISTYTKQWSPVFNANAKYQLTYPGEIWPQRYANVYQYYDYDSSGKATNVDIKPIYTDAATNKLNVKTTTDENIDADNADPTARKNIISSLDGKQWHYTGTMTSGGTADLPLADATVNLAQSLKPQIDLNAGGLYVVNDDDLKQSGGVTNWLGYYRDPLLISNNDQLSGTQTTSGTATDKATQTAKWSSMVTDTQSHRLNLNLGTNNPFVNADLSGWDKPYAEGITPSVDSSNNETGDGTYHFAMPNDTFDEGRLYFNTITLKRRASVKTHNDYSLQKAVDGQADASYLVYRNPSPAPDNNVYTIDKFFSGTDDIGDEPTRHFVKAPDGKTVPDYSVTAHVNINGKKANQEDTMTLLIPKVGTGTSALHLKAAPTVVAMGGGDDPSVSGAEGLPAALTDQYYAYDLTFAEPPKTTFTYTYDYVGPDKTTAFPADFLNRGLIDVLMNKSQLLASSNAIYFASWKNVNLVSVPSLDFGKRTLPGTAGGVYPLAGLSGTGTDQQVTDSDTANAAKSAAKLEVQDNLNNQSSWTVSGRLDAFNNQATNTDYDGFQINLGLPATDTKGTSEGLPVPPASGPVTDAQKAYVNHDPLTMVAGGAAVNLYKVSRLVEADANATPLTRYYTNATLTVPANMPQTVTKGKYTTTITYSVLDGTL
ncbi:hypothetical protein L248_1220 [Schleiferilactobacillus shenzhenensis LY-73]|uniref:Uncharacterized protein n=2 Tax=Schleiferilactobacillus shenzhenensis TaxID=1231337 RepID=U4TWA5_9LACO|nr:hypothetical protein L248_1220 [Schleiferilactobacillus shenzhenensis LY-73]